MFPWISSLFLSLFLFFLNLPEFSKKLSQKLVQPKIERKIDVRAKGMMSLVGWVSKFFVHSLRKIVRKKGAAGMAILFFFFFAKRAKLRAWFASCFFVTLILSFFLSPPCVSTARCRWISEISWSSWPKSNFAVYVHCFVLQEKGASSDFEVA